MKYDNIRNEIQNIQADRMRTEKLTNFDLVNYFVFEREVGNVQEQINKAKADLTDLQTRANNLQSNLSTLQTNVSNLQSQVNTLQTNVNNLQSQVNTLQTNVSNLQSQVNTLQTNVNNLQSQVNTIQTDVNDLKTRMTRYQTTIGNAGIYTINICGNNGLARLVFYNTLAELFLIIRNTNPPIVSGRWTSTIKTEFQRDGNGNLRVVLTIPTVFDRTGASTTFSGLISIDTDTPISTTGTFSTVSPNIAGLRGTDLILGLNNTQTIDGISNSIYIPILVGERISYWRYNGQSNFNNANMNGVNLVGFYLNQTQRFMELQERNIGYSLIFNSYYLKVGAVWLNANHTGWRFKQLWIHDNQNTINTEEQNYTNYRVVWSYVTTGITHNISKHKSSAGLDIVTARITVNNPGGEALGYATQRGTFSGVSNFRFNSIDLQWDTSNGDGGLYLVFERLY